ncbi:MAG TPA: ATP-binding protein [Herbaspirillum sp.]
MTDNTSTGSFSRDDCDVPFYNRRMLHAVGLALSIAVLTVSAALALDQMGLVIDSVQRRNYVEQLDILKNSQRKLVYSLDQTAKLHSRLLVEQHRSHICNADIVFPGDLSAAPRAYADHAKTMLHITSTLDDTGCGSRFRLLRRLSHSLAISIHNLWNYPEISSYTFDPTGNFLAQSHGIADMPSASSHSAQKRIFLATAALQTGVRRLRKAHASTLPFFTDVHPRDADSREVFSVGVPIYSKEKLFAITAIDIERNAFNQVFLQDGRLAGFFVFDTSHASPKLLNDISSEERPLVQSILKHWADIHMVAHDMTATKIGHRFYLAETIAGTPWVAIYSFSFGDIFLASESLWMWVGFSMFGALLLLWSGIYIIDRYMLRARNSAKEANAAKAMFLATVSHEIRTPLHGAMGNLELLEKTPLSPAQHSTIDTINRAFFSLLQIVNNVLDLSKAGAGQLHLRRETFDLTGLLEDVARTFAPCIAKKQVDFFCLLDCRLPQRLAGDETRLRQIFNNLLSNALKFTSNGRIVMRADLKEFHARACSFTVRIVDSGIGISEHDQKKLFMPFQQANKSIAGNFGGTGLGLSLARNLCEAMGGTIEVDSREYQGASFTVALTLPIAKDPEESGAAAPASALSGIVIALCCDDHAWRGHLRRQLEAAGATVLKADEFKASSAAAIRPAPPCDTVLIACQDNQAAIHLPRLAASPHARHVIVTPLGPLPPERQDDCIRVSALSRHGLLAAVDPRLPVAPMPGRSCSGLVPPTASVRAANSRPLPAHPAADAARLNILLVDDDLTNVTLAQQQLAMLGYHRIDLANNGLDALEKCNEQAYQLVLTDQFMPGMDGNRLAATLRKQSYPARIIMITASRPSAQDRQNLDAVLLKPASLDQLKSVLASHCGPAPQAKADAETDAKTDAEPASIPATMPATVPSGHAILWNAFLQDYENTMQTLELAARHGERAQCLAQLHKLKGALEILRQPLAKQVAILEQHSKTASFNALEQAYRELRQALDGLIAARNRGVD